MMMTQARFVTVTVTSRTWNRWLGAINSVGRFSGGDRNASL